MSHIKDHSKKYKILEEAKKDYPMPDLDKILPPNIEAIEDSMTEQEFDRFVTKKFNGFYSKYVNSSVKDLFVKLPLEFFTTENIERVRWYANIAFDIKAENAKNSKDEIVLPGSEKYYENMHTRFLEMLKKKHEELLAKKKHEQTLYL